MIGSMRASYSDEIEILKTYLQKMSKNYFKLFWSLCSPSATTSQATGRRDWAIFEQRPKTFLFLAKMFKFSPLFGVKSWPNIFLDFCFSPLYHHLIHTFVDWVASFWPSHFKHQKRLDKSFIHFWAKNVLYQFWANLKLDNIFRKLGFSKVSKSVGISMYWI